MMPDPDDKEPTVDEPVDWNPDPDPGPLAAALDLADLLDEDGNIK